MGNAATTAARLVATPRNPIPGGGTVSTMTTRDGAGIRFACWNASVGTRLGTVCLFPGRGEFIEKYFETIADLRRRGLAVAVMDWRGQGGSSRLLSNSAKGHARSFARHDQDVRQFMSEIVLPDCPPPYFALAHSMGGHLILRLAQMKLCWWDRIVLSAPMIRFAGSETQTALRCAMARTLATVGLGTRFIPGGSATAWEATPFDGNLLTSDRLRFERVHDILQAAPQLGIGSPTIGWASAACTSIGKITAPEFIDKIKVPILIVAAGNDRIVSTDAIEHYASRLKTCTRIVIAGSRHEIMQERDELREQFWAAFDAWIPGSGAGVRQSETSDVVR